jgi:hypothetical protein
MKMYTKALHQFQHIVTWQLKKPKETVTVWEWPINMLPQQ